MKLIPLKVDNSNIMSSYERASLKITSPSGQTIRLYKKELGKMTEEQRKTFWKFCKDPMYTFRGEILATKEEMETLLAISKL